MTLTLANSELAVGLNRFAMGLIAGGRPVPDAQVLYEFFEVEGQTGTKRAEIPAAYRALDANRGIYVARVTFDRPGSWGVQATVTRPGEPAALTRSAFEVLAQGHAPMPGQRAIPSQNPTARDVASLVDICSATPPCDMHVLSVQQAVSRGKPSVVTFSTPGYCTSQLCAPVLNEVQKVKQRWEARAEFAHVEIYKDPRNLVVADAVTEWGLVSEPWVFILDRAGVIVDRMESITVSEEIESALAAVL